MDQSASNLVYSFILGILAYFIFLPFYKSRKSFIDAIAARKSVKILKLLIALETVLCLPLLYSVYYYGNPISTPLSSYALPYSSTSSTSWVYGHGRPLFGIVFVGIGVFGDMHPAPRYVCIISALFQGILDAMSSVLVYSYRQQVMTNGAPSGNFTSASMAFYMYRDLLSFAVLVYLVLMCSHVSCVLGWCAPHYISFPVLAGGHLDRCEVLRLQMHEREDYEIRRRFIRTDDNEEEDGGDENLLEMGTMENVEVDGLSEMQPPTRPPLLSRSK